VWKYVEKIGGPNRYGITSLGVDAKVWRKQTIHASTNLYPHHFSTILLIIFISMNLHIVRKIIISAHHKCHHPVVGSPCHPKA
jgi:hypothetical protein